MKDYTKELGFWKRLESFVSDVQTGCCAGEEEKEMIMHCCKLKILDLQNVTNSLPKLDLDTADNLVKETDYACYACEDTEEINWGDAAAFFIEGYNYAIKKFRQ